MNRLKTTIPAFLYQVSEERDGILQRLMQKYGFMLRYSFKRLLEGKEKNELQSYLSKETGLSVRHAQDALEDARQVIKSQHELVKLHVSLWEVRLKKAEKKLERLEKSKTSIRKIKANRSKVEKRKRKVEYWKSFAETQSFPSVVFGGKKAFQERCKGTLSKEDWQEGRNGRICSRGDATKKGNPNLRVLFDGERFSFQINIDQKKENGKHFEQIVLPLYIPRKVSKKTGAIHGRDYFGMMRDFLQTGKPYQVEILRRKGKYHVHISIEEKEANLCTYPACGLLGVDTNPDGFGVAHVLPDGNPTSFQWLGDGGLRDASTNKKEHIIGNLAKQFVLGGKREGTAIGVEDLRFIQDREVSAKFHRMSHSFCYRRLLEAIERNCLRYGVELIKVKPAYTSVIGRFKYQPQFGISVHQSAALVIGRRALGYDFELVPKALMELGIKKEKQVGFQKMNNWKQWSAIQQSLLKLLKQKGGSLISWLDTRKELLSSM